MNESPRTPRLLIVLDGFGYREDTEDNAIANANTPVWDRLWAEAPHTLISGSGKDVGLPEGQMGNSEVGHMSLGSGRVIYQNMTRIDHAIETGTFNTNPAYCDAIDAARDAGGAVHLMGLLSPGGVHSHERHFAAAIRLAHARGAKRVYLHAFLDGRDTPPRSAEPSLLAMQNLFSELGCGRVASVTGRYYAMDRDNRWDRTEQAWALLTRAEAPYTATSATAALADAYDRDENDEFVKPTLVRAAGEPEVKIADGDSVLFMNFRADRARQLSRAFVDADFDNFDRGAVPALSAFVQTTEYAADIVNFANGDMVGHTGKLIRRNREQLETLRNQRRELLVARGRQQELISREMQTAYQMGKQAQLRVLLNQEDPATLARAMTYYDYFYQARLEHISRYLEIVERINTLEPEIRGTTRTLEANEQTLETQQGELLARQRQRQRELAELNATIETKDQRLQKLSQDQEELQRLLEVIEQAVAELEVPDAYQPFANAQGSMPWPVAGRASNRYGARRGGGSKLRWQGLVIPAEEGSEVNAIHHGRVVFADWFRGSGLLLIIDHGDGYMSLYARNQALLRDVGEWVSAGSAVATVGNSGGQAESALYFEIREGGKPTNPGPWLE